MANKCRINELFFGRHDGNNLPLPLRRAVPYILLLAHVGPLLLVTERTNREMKNVSVLSMIVLVLTLDLCCNSTWAVFIFLMPWDLKTLLSVFHLESFRFSPSSKTIRLPANSLTRYRLNTAAADSYCFGEHIFFKWICSVCQRPNPL